MNADYSLSISQGLKIPLAILQTISLKQTFALYKLMETPLEIYHDYSKTSFKNGVLQGMFVIIIRSNNNLN